MVVMILGSKKDQVLAKAIAVHLKKLAVSHKIVVASAHKTPLALLGILEKYGKVKNIVFICVAGRSNALGGFVDANSPFPVINCPPYSEKFAGLDILSSLRMPSFVAPLTVLEPDQAALAAAKILALNDNKLQQRIEKLQSEVKKELTQ